MSEKIDNWLGFEADWTEFFGDFEESETDWINDRTMTLDEIAAFERRQLEREGAI